MSIVNYFVNTYSLNSFLSTVGYEEVWGIKDKKKFRQTQEKNLEAAIKELETYPSRSISNQDLRRKLKEVAERAQYVKNHFVKEDANDLRKVMVLLLEKLETHLNQMIEEARELPLTAFTYVEINGPLKSSNFTQPLAFFESIVDGDGIATLKNEFYDFQQELGFSIDEGTEICIHMEEEGWIVKFGDELCSRIAEEQPRSLKLVGDYVIQNPAEADSYLKGVYHSTQSLLSRCKSAPANKYLCVEGALKNIKRSLSRTYPSYLHSIRTKSVPVLTKKSGFELWLKRGLKLDNALKQFHQKLIRCRFIDKNTSLITVKKVFKGERSTERIVWLGNTESLRYLIRTLIDKGVIGITGNRKWEAVSNSFVKADHSEFNPILLGKCHEPTYTKTLDEAAQLLISLKSS